MIDEKIEKYSSRIFLGSEITVCPRASAREKWDDALGAASYQPVCYSQSDIDYQYRYFSGEGKEYFDFSLVIFQQNKAIAIWPLSFSRNREILELHSFSTGVLPPLFIKSTTQKLQKTVVKLCLQLLELIAAENHIYTVKCTEVFDDSIGLSEWFSQARKYSCCPVVSPDLFVDLSLEGAGVWQSFRKSYKPLINKASGLWNVSVVETYNAIWAEFQALHLEVAGRVTRSQESWDEHSNHLENGSAFLVTLREAGNDCLVGAGLFHYTESEGSYSVAAYKRELFDKPLGHLVQWQAMQTFISKKIRYYRIGSMLFKNDVPEPTEKELSISYFKSGFATHWMPRYSFELSFRSTLDD